jgi:hypothetical protein
MGRPRNRIESYEEALAAIVVPIVAEMRKRGIGSVEVVQTGSGSYSFDLQPVRRRRAAQAGPDLDDEAQPTLPALSDMA